MSEAEGRDKCAPDEAFVLISDSTLKALHRRLLESLERKTSEKADRLARSGVERYAAAKVAVWFDMNDGDAVCGAADQRDLLGAALLHKTRKDRGMALAWGCEVDSKRWQDVLEAARAHSLPVVFVCDADDRKRMRSRLPHENAKLKPGEEMPSITVDGNDVVAVYRVAHEAIDRARRDRGPSLIMLATYRVGKREFANAVEDMENYLRGRKLLGAGNGE